MYTPRKCLIIGERGAALHSGTVHKALAQYAALQELFAVEFVTRRFNHPWLRTMDGKLLWPLRVVIKALANKNCLIFYRYTPTHILLNWIFYLLRNRIKLFVEINTKNRDEYQLGPHWYYFTNLLCERKIYQAAHAVLAVTPEIGAYVQTIEPRCQIRFMGNGYEPPNGVTPPLPPSREAELRQVLERTEGKKKFIWVGQPAPWHGLDKILDIMTHLENSCLFIVGEKDLIKQIGMFTELSTCNKVMLLGKRDFSELQFLYPHCDMAFGVFGLERKNMKEAVSLKVREYLYYGLPVIDGCIDPQLGELDFVHRYRDLDSLRAFIDQEFDRESIKRYARENLSWRVIFRKVFAPELNG